MQLISYLEHIIGWDFSIVSLSLELSRVRTTIMPEWMISHSRADVLNPDCTLESFGHLLKLSVYIFSPRYSDSNNNIQ